MRGDGMARRFESWVGSTGSVVGTDVDDKMLANAKRYLQDSEVTNVELKKDDLFKALCLNVRLTWSMHDFKSLPLAAPAEQLAAYLKLIRPVACSYSKTLTCHRGELIRLPQACND